MESVWLAASAVGWADDAGALTGTRGISDPNMLFEGLKVVPKQTIHGLVSGL